MRALNKNYCGLFGFLAMAFGMGLVPSLASAGPSVKSEMKRCLDIWLPPGTKESEQKWYNPDLRCEANREVPKLDEQRCEKTVSRLAELSSELNTMVTDACRTYVPELVADGCKQQSNDPHCIDKEQEILRRASENSQVFVAKLNKFVKRLSQLREISLQGAGKVYEATAYAEKYSQKMDSANGYFAELTGDQTAGDFIKRNQHQAAGPLRELLADFQRHSPSDISGASLGTAAAQAEISKRATGLDKAWRSLDQKVASPFAYEQLVNALDTEEAHLKMMQYKNDLARMTKGIDSMHATNSQAMAKLSSLDGNSPPPSASQGVSSGAGAAAANGLMAAAAPQLSGESGNAAGRTSAFANAGPGTQGESFAFTPIRVRGSGGFGAAQTGADERAKIELGSTAPGTAAESEESGKANRSGSSRYRASLRDALRQKLARDLTGEKAESPTFASSASPATMKGSPSLGASPKGRQLASVSSEAAASFGGFEGSLSEGGFALAGAEHDDFVNGLVADFEGAMNQAERPAIHSAEIGAPDSSPLFERVKLYHERCLREGRVQAKE